MSEICGTHMDLTEFTTEELLALASGLQLRDPVFLAGEPFTTWSPEVRGEVDAIGRRSLAARSVIELDDDGRALVPDLLLTLCAIISEPDLYVRISNVDPEGFRMASFLVTRESCVGLRLTRLGNYRFTLISSSQARAAMAEILKLADLTSAKASSSPDIEVPAEELQRLLDSRTDQPDGDIDTFLQRAGIDPDVAAALRPLMNESASGWSVEVLAPSLESRTLQGSVTAWVTTSAGAWMATTDATDEGSQIRYRSVGGNDLQASIDEGLPAWLSG